MNISERRRQRSLAAERPPLERDAFVGRLIDGELSRELAEYLWDAFQPYYFAPLTPYPTDRIYGDMKIDPEDINDIAIEYETRFGIRLKGSPIACPDDPTITEFGLALRDASR